MTSDCLPDVKARLVRLFILLLWLVFVDGYVHSQGVIAIPADLHVEVDSADQALILSHLERLLWQIDQDSIDEEYIHGHGFELSKTIFSSLRYPSDQEISFNRRTLVNFYPVSKTRSCLIISVHEHSSASDPMVPKILMQLHAIRTGSTVKFTSPLWWKTRHWTSEQVGTIKYISQEKINRVRANIFNQKNAQIAAKFQEKADPLEFYICENYQEILQLLGVLYDRDEAGTVEDGWGVVDHTIFSIRGNEDFSHDIFHYYSGKVNEHTDRNWIAEEGLAYLWGNAYYVDKEAEMVDQDRLSQRLIQRMEDDKDLTLLTLFENNPPFFQDINRRISVRSVIAGLLCHEIERKWGMKGVKQIINCGRKPNSTINFLEEVDSLLGINRDNFNTAVYQLLIDSQ